eukprot:766715-Hanusia_phi.AAC.14
MKRWDMSHVKCHQLSEKKRKVLLNNRLGGLVSGEENVLCRTAEHREACCHQKASLGRVVAYSLTLAGLSLFYGVIVHLEYFRCRLLAVNLHNPWM